MIVYAACVADQAKFDAICQPGIARTFRDGDVMVTTSSTHSIFEAYNEVLDAFRDRDDLEALVLLHEDTEILHRRFAPTLLGALRQPDLAIVGVVGGTGMRGIAWWHGDRQVGRVEETRRTLEYDVREGDVEAVDGLLLALSPWAVRNLRFDDHTYTGFDGYDADFCRQARVAGKRVRCVELPVAHRHDRDGEVRVSSDNNSFCRADAAFRAKWNPDVGLPVTDARARARIQQEWLLYLAPLIPAGARRVLYLGDDVAGPGDPLGEMCPGATVVPVADLADVPDGERFDAVVLPDALERTHAPDALIARARDLLDDDGALVLSAPNAASFGYFLGLLAVCSNPAGWAFAQSLEPPLHPYTLSELVDLADRNGLSFAGLSLSGHDRSGEAGPIIAAADAGYAAASPPPKGAASAIQRLTAVRYYASARIAGAAAAPPPPPVLGSVVDEALLELVDPSAQRIARIDVMLPPGGDVVADDAILRAIASLDDGPYDAVVLGTALDHARVPEVVLRAARSLVSAEGAVLATLTNLLRVDLLGGLLERDAWTYGEGALAGFPVRQFTQFDLAILSADGGLYVDRVEDELLPHPDPARIAVWTRIADELEVGKDIGTHAAVGRMRVVMRHPGP